MKEKDKTVLFKNKLIDSPKFGESFTYCDMATMVFNTPPTQGVTMVQMVERIDAIKIFKQKKDIKITQSNLNELISAFEKMTWQIVDEKIPEFYNYIKELKEEF